MLPIQSNLRKKKTFLWTFFDTLIKTGNFLKFEKQVKSSVQKFFSAVEPRIIFKAVKIILSVYKDAVPTTQQSLVAYQYLCRSDCQHVNRTSLRLQERITHHIPKSIRNKEKPTKILPRRNCKANSSLNQFECDSVIGLHLLQNPDCAAHYHDRELSISAKARS